ncbi:MAG: recombinase family protein [Schwartzia sp. (in: firmicutes)]
MPKIQKRAALYIRVSTEEQARHGYSLAEQEHDLRQYAEQHGYTVVGLYADEGVSARKSFSRRKEMQRLLEDVAMNTIDIIIFKCLDRWFRSVADYYKVQEILDRHGVGWECSQEADYNTTTTNGRLMLNLKLSIAQHESDQTGDRVRYVQEGLKREGKVITGHMPMGYVIDAKKHIGIDEAAAPMVRDMFQHFLTHRTVMSTFRMLRQKYGYKKTEGSVGRLLQNRIYIGEYYGVKQFCPAIIDEGTFAQAQTLFTRRTRHPQSNRIYLFFGLLRCPACGRILTPRNRTAGGKVQTYYACRDHTHGRGCPHKTYWREDYIEGVLLSSIEQDLIKYLADIKKAVRSVGTENHAVTAEELRAKQERIKELYIAGLIQREEFNARIAEVNGQIAAIRPSAPPKIAYLETVVSNNLITHYEGLERSKRKMFWSRILDQVNLSDSTPKPVFRMF